VPDLTGATTGSCRSDSVRACATTDRLLPRICRATRALALGLLLAGCAAAQPNGAEDIVAGLAGAMDGKRIVLLGEVHDNPAQHSLRLQALQRLVSGGARPALAFEQFDRERQSDVDSARRTRPRDATHLIGRARSGVDSWDWERYRPFIQLALDHDLPIVAANLSRADGARVVKEGFGAIFDERERRALELDTLPESLLQAHRHAVDAGHCRMLPANLLEPFARAQIARDAVLAQRIRRYADRGVVLLTGNAHARNDIGVPYWLTDAERRATVSIAMLEGNGGEMPDASGAFDARFFTAPVRRPDPCAGLERRLPPPSSQPPRGDAGAASAART
jgi:uncharacterized iron-regulated protein